MISTFLSTGHSVHQGDNIHVLIEKMVTIFFIGSVTLCQLKCRGCIRFRLIVKHISLGKYYHAYIKLEGIVTFQVTMIFGLGFLSFLEAILNFCWVSFIMTD